MQSGAGSDAAVLPTRLVGWSVQRDQHSPDLRGGVRAGTCLFGGRRVRHDTTPAAPPQRPHSSQGWRPPSATPTPPAPKQTGRHTAVEWGKAGLDGYCITQHSPLPTPEPPAAPAGPEGDCDPVSVGAQVRPVFGLAARILSPCAVVLCSAAAAAAASGRLRYRPELLQTKRRMEASKRRKCQVANPTSALVPFVPDCAVYEVVHRSWLAPPSGSPQARAATPQPTPPRRASRKASRVQRRGGANTSKHSWMDVSDYDRIPAGVLQKLFREAGPESVAVPSCEDARTRLAGGLKKHGVVRNVDMADASGMWHSLLHGTAVEMHGVALPSDLRSELRDMLMSLQLRHVPDPFQPKAEPAPCPPPSSPHRFTLQVSPVQPQTPTFGGLAPDRSSCPPSPMCLMTPSTPVTPVTPGTHSAQKGWKKKKSMLGVSFCGELSTGSRERRGVSFGGLDQAPSASRRSRSRSRVGTEARRRSQRGSVVPLVSMHHPVPSESQSQTQALKIPGLPDLVLSEAAWLTLTFKMHRWKQEVVARLEHHRWMAELHACEVQWEMRVVRQSLGLWKLNTSWRLWMRRRYLRKCWVAWQTFNQWAHDRKVGAMLQLGHALTSLTQYKTFQVWRRLSLVEQCHEQLSPNLFANEIYIPQWDAFYRGYLKERAMQTAMRDFVMRNRVRRCFFSLQWYTGQRLEKKARAMAANQMRAAREGELAQRLFKVMNKRATLRRGSKHYLHSLLARGFSRWQVRFRHRTLLGIYQFHLEWKRDQTKLRESLEYWVMQKRQQSQLKVLLTLRCTLYPSAMLHIIHTLRDTPQFLVAQAFRRWSRNVRMHTRFMVFATEALRKQAGLLKKSAFITWRTRVTPFQRNVFKWEAVTQVKQAIDQVTQVKQLLPVESTIHQALQKEVGRRPCVPSTVLFSAWANGEVDGSVILKKVLFRMVLHSTTRRQIQYRRNQLAGRTLHEEVTDGITVNACYDRFRMQECTAREISIRLQLEALRKRLTPADHCSNTRLAALLPQIARLVPHFCNADPKGGYLIKEAAFVSFLQAGVLRYVRIAALQRYRDPLLLESGTVLLPGLTSRRLALKRLAAAITVIHWCVAKTRRARVLSTHDVSSLRLSKRESRKKSKMKPATAAELGLSVSQVIAAMRAVLLNGCRPEGVTNGHIAIIPFKDLACLHQLINPEQQIRSFG